MATEEGENPNFSDYLSDHQRADGQRENIYPAKTIISIKPSRKTPNPIKAMKNGLFIWAHRRIKKRMLSKGTSSSRLVDSL